MRHSFLLLIGIVTLASAQSPALDAATVKATASDPIPAFVTGPTDEMMRFKQHPGRINYAGVTLKMLLKRAYSVASEQIAGPG